MDNPTGPGGEGQVNDEPHGLIELDCDLLKDAGIPVSYLTSLASDHFDVRNDVYLDFDHLNDAGIPVYEVPGMPDPDVRMWQGDEEAGEHTEPSDRAVFEAASRVGQLPRIIPPATEEKKPPQPATAKQATGESENPKGVPARSLSTDDDRWLLNTGSWIPKKYREPWLHDILEDREGWRAAGWSWKRIELHTVVQFINAMILNPRTWFAALFSWVASKFWPCQ